jgi:hypothetical protein
MTKTVKKKTSQLLRDNGVSLESLASRVGYCKQEVSTVLSKFDRGEPMRTERAVKIRDMAIGILRGYGVW